jgi:5-methyltetrahydropteroyltriglutamate--homocysteine methyltransferase
MKFSFLTHEIGSLSKPEWRVRSALQKPIRNQDINQAVDWGERLYLNYQPLIQLLKKKTKGKQTRQQIVRWASRYAIRLEEKAGLDVVYDGEQHRSEMYQYPIMRSRGFKFSGNIRSFDNKYYRKAICTSQPGLKQPYHVNEFKFVQATATRQVKIPITGAYTLGAWSFDQHYTGKTQAIGTKKAIASQTKNRRQFILDIARHIVRPNIIKLIKAGATWIQIDEPAATTIPEEVPLFVDAFNATVKGLDCRFSCHICFSDYRLLFPHLHRAQKLHEVHLEISNRDSKKLGVKHQLRPGYQILRFFKKQGFKPKVGVGVVDIHTDYLESPELIRDRILYAAKILGPDNIYAATDCGLRTRTWEVSFQKMQRLAHGAFLASQAI